MIRAFLIPLAAVALIVMAGCGPSGPREADMVGCAVRGGEVTSTRPSTTNSTR